MHYVKLYSFFIMNFLQQHFILLVRYLVKSQYDNNGILNMHSVMNAVQTETAE